MHPIYGGGFPKLGFHLRGYRIDRCICICMYRGYLALYGDSHKFGVLFRVPTIIVMAFGGLDWGSLFRKLPHSFAFAIFCSLQQEQPLFVESSNCQEKAEAVGEGQGR